MEFTHEQISEIISEITNGEQGLQGLGKQGFESLMLSERSLHNCSHQDVSNGYREDVYKRQPILWVMMLKSVI